MTTYYCVSSLPFPYGIRVTISWVYIGISHLWLLNKSMWINSLWIKCLWPQNTCTYTITRIYIGISHLWLLHKSMWIKKNSLLIKCLWPQTTCTYTISRVYKGISNLWLWHKSMWIEKTVCESNVYDLKLLVHTLSQEFILVSPIYDFCIKVCKSKKQYVNQKFTTSNYLYIHYLASLYRYLPFMTFA